MGANKLRVSIQPRVRSQASSGCGRSVASSRCGIGFRRGQPKYTSAIERIYWHSAIQRFRLGKWERKRVLLVARWSTFARRCSSERSAQKTQELVFIGAGMDREAITSALEGCLEAKL